MLVQISWECTPPYLSIGISILLQPAQAEVVLGQLSAYLASWMDTEAKTVYFSTLYTVTLCSSTHCILYTPPLSRIPTKGGADSLLWCVKHGPHGTRHWHFQISPFAIGKFNYWIIESSSTYFHRLQNFDSNNKWSLNKNLDPRPYIYLYIHELSLKEITNWA